MRVVHRPEGDRPWPMLFTRLPYGKDGQDVLQILAARRGFVVIVQDCRRRFASDGEWIPFQLACRRMSG
ncbi:MAG: CocE/NonD family hydrolase [Candidatus Dormibacteraceae bacterium]